MAKNGKLISVEGLPSKVKRQVYRAVQGNDNFTVIETGSWGPFLVRFGTKRETLEVERELLHVAFALRGWLLKFIQPALRKNKTVILFDYLAYEYATILFGIHEELVDRTHLSNKFFKLYNEWCMGLYPDISIYIPTEIASAVDAIREQENISPHLNKDAFDTPTETDILAEDLFRWIARGYDDFGSRCHVYDPAPLYEIYNSGIGGVWAELRHATEDVIRVLEADAAERNSPMNASIESHEPRYHMGATRWIHLGTNAPEIMVERALQIIEVAHES